MGAFVFALIFIPLVVIGRGLLELWLYWDEIKIKFQEKYKPLKINTWAGYSKYTRQEDSPRSIKKVEGFK